MSLTLTRKNTLRHLKLHHVISRCSASARPAEAVFIAKDAEVPVICVTDEKNVDLIGPPDPISNLRPIVRRIKLNETALQQKLREFQDETQRWNQKFWSDHNTKFFKERQEYIKRSLKPGEERQTLSADEMSEFYKAFLDKNWKVHVNYNFEWYKKNFALLYLALRVNLEGLWRHS